MRRLRFLALFLWAVFLLGLTLWRFPVPLQGGLGLLRSGAICALLLTAALAHGRAVLMRFKLYHGSLLEEAGFSLSLGLLVLSLLGSLLGALGVCYDWVILIILTLAFIVHWEHLESLADTLARSLRSKHAFEGRSSEVATVMALALAGIAVAALCLAPPTFYDALVYHLADAQRTALLGRAVPQPDVLFSWLPSLPEPLWALAMALDGDPLRTVQAAALLNLAAYALLGLMILDASARLLSERRLWLAPALALTQPLVALSFGVFSPDGWMALYAFLSLNAFLLGLAERTLRVQANWLWLSALLAGAAVAAKPTALAHAGALLFLLTALVLQEPGQRRVRVLLGGLVLFMVPLLPWLLRGALLKGQPFYPFPADFFGWSLGEGGPAAYFRHVQGYGDRDWLRLPYNVFFEPAVLGGGGHLSFLMLILVPASLAWSLSRELRWTGFYLAVGLACWALGPHVLRYALFLVPAACLLAAHGAVESENGAQSRGWTFAWRSLVIAGLGLGAWQTLTIAVKDFDPLPAALGLEDHGHYLERRGVPQAKATAWIRAQAGSSTSKTLLLGDARSAWLPAQALTASVFETHPLATWVAQAATPEDVSATVRRKGYDFVVLNRVEWERLRQQSAPPRYWPAGDDAARQRFQAWIGLLEALPPERRLDEGGLLVARLR